MFELRNWQDEVRTPSNTYTQTTNADGTVTLTKAGTVIQSGTNENAVNFNAMDEGILDAYIATCINQASEMAKRREVDSRLDFCEADTKAESGTIALTNSLEFPFNNSVKTVSLSQKRATLNYDVDVWAVESNGLPGDLVISDKQLNGFKIAFEGSATAVTIGYKVRGGMNS